MAKMISIELSAKSGSKSFTKTGPDSFREITSSYRWFTDKMEGVTAAAVVEALEPTKDKAVSYTPVKTGALAASVYLEEMQFRKGARAELGFAKGGDPEYAIIVHEMDYSHAAPTSKKFLQRALEEMGGTVQLFRHQ
jgi:hypothetical protein